MNSKELVWDTTLYPCEYPNDIKKIFFHNNIINRKKYTFWISRISKKFTKNFDWWLSPPASRNPLISDLHKKITILETLDKVKGHYSSIQIIVNTKKFKYLLREWLNKEKINYNIRLKLKKNIFKNKFIPLKTFVFYFLIYLYINIFVKKKIIKDDRKITLIDVWQTNIYKNKNYDFLIKKYDINSKNVFFCPKFLIERNLLKIFQIINSIKSSNYIFKEHYLNVFDFLKCFYPRSLKKIVKSDFVKYKKWSLREIIIDELFELSDYPSIYLAKSNYYFCKKMKEKKIKIHKSINWFENQTVDKGWNYSFRKFFPETKIFGYQGFTHYMQLMNTIPAEHEEKAEVIAKEVYTIGRAYVKMKKEFFPKLKVNVAPALNYQNIFNNYKKTFTNKLLVILSGIRELDCKVLDWTYYFLDQNKNAKVIIKAHPIMPFERLSKNKKTYEKQIRIYNGNLDAILKKTHSVICSGPTSATLESLAFNCYLIVPVLEPCDKENIKNLNIKKNLYSFVYNKFDLNKIMQKILKQNKKICTNNSKIKNFLFKKINNKNASVFF